MPTVAIVGASRDHRKFGNKAVRAYRSAGWRVIPVNPEAEEIEGIPAVASLAEIGESVDRVSVYLPPATTRELLPSMADVEPDEVWLNPGAADAATVEEGRRLGLPIVEGCSIVDIGKRPAEFP